jgi:hypothetical protein
MLSPVHLPGAQPSGAAYECDEQSDASRSASARRCRCAALLDRGGCSRATGSVDAAPCRHCGRWRPAMTAHRRRSASRSRCQHRPARFVRSELDFQKNWHKHRSFSMLGVLSSQGMGTASRRSIAATRAGGALTALLLLLPAARVHAKCTSIGVGRLASADGSTMATHNADCLDCDFRLGKVPARDWPEGSMRPVVKFRAEYPRTGDARAKMCVHSARATTACDRLNALAKTKVETMLQSPAALAEMLDIQRLRLRCTHLPLLEIPRLRHVVLITA